MREISIPKYPPEAGQAAAGAEADVRESNPVPERVTGFRKSWIRMRQKWTLFQILRRCYNNPLDWIRGLEYLAELRRSILGDHRIRKMVRINGLYYSDLYVPGWKDIAYDQFVSSELSRFKAHQGVVHRFRQVFLAITKKCPLQCEHCSAWDTLNMKDTLGAEEFRQVIRQVHQLGYSQLYFTGGEPLVKFQLLETLVAQLPETVRSWIATSGYQLTREKAKRLKQAGLTGLFVSLDHYEEERHNTFRNNKTAYSWALEAAQNALEAGLAVAFSVCLNDELCRQGELMKYMDFARDCGVHFVQFLEPQPVGHYANQNVALSEESIKSVEALYLEMNYGKNHLDYPLIHYIEYYHRRIGCFGGGKQVVYIDADGNLNACPFCQAPGGNLLEGGLEEKANSMAARGCPQFGSV